MTRITRNLWIFVVAVLMLLIASQLSCPWLWWGRQTAVTVTDAKSGNPVVGAIVVASWSITGAEGALLDLIGVEESITGEDGVAAVPGWGPRLSFAGYSSMGSLAPGGFDEMQPRIYVLSSGYIPKVQFARFPATSTTARQEIAKDGIRVKLEQVASTRGNYNDLAIAATVRSLRPVYEGKRCLWKRIPKAVSTLETMYAPLRPRDIYGAAPPYMEISKDHCRPLPAYITGGEK